jgi:hypothetical protein
VKPEHRHSFDCMYEMGSISAAELYWFYEICPNTDETMDRLSETANDHESRDHWQHLLNFEKDVSDYAYEAIAADTNSIRRLRCHFNDVLHHDYQTNMLVWESLDDIFPIRAERMARSVNRSFHEIRIAPIEAVATAAKSLIECRKRKRDKYLKNIRKTASLLRRVIPQAARPKKQITKAVRSAYLRSYNLAKSVFGTDRLKSILSARQMDVTGQLYKYRVTFPKTSLSTGGHGQTKTTVLTLDDQEVCDLCIYSNNCTLIDHLVSIHAHVTTGEELEILQTANVYNVRGVEVQEHARFIKGGSVSFDGNNPMIPPELMATIVAETAERETVNKARRKNNYATVQSMLNVDFGERAEILEPYFVELRKSLFA